MALWPCGLDGFMQNLRCVPNQSLDHWMGWQQKWVCCPNFSCDPKKNGWKKRLCVWSLAKLSYNWGWWLVWFGIQNRPLQRTSKRSRTGPLPTPFRFPTCFVVGRAAKQRSLVVGRRIGHPRNGLTLKARHRDLLGQHWFSLDIKITSIKNNI